MVSTAQDQFHSGSSMLHERPRFSLKVTVFGDSSRNFDYVFSQSVRTGVSSVGERFFPHFESAGGSQPRSQEWCILTVLQKSCSWQAQKSETSRQSQISMLGAPFPLLWNSPCSPWKSNATLTKNFGSSGASLRRHRRWKMAKMAKLAQCHIGRVPEFLGALGCRGIHYLPSPLTLGSLLSFTWDFLRMPAVIFFVSATVPRDSQGFHSQDEWIVALLCFLLFLMYQGK